MNFKFFGYIVLFPKKNHQGFFTQTTFFPYPSQTLSYRLEFAGTLKKEAIEFQLTFPTIKPTLTETLLQKKLTTLTRQKKLPKSVKNFI